MGFVERFDAWVRLEAPSSELRRHVLTWIFTRSDDPYGQARRADGFEDLWVAVVPRSGHGEGLVVICSYWVDPRSNTVTCDNFGSLGLP